MIDKIPQLAQSLLFILEISHINRQMLAQAVSFYFKRNSNIDIIAFFTCKYNQN